MEAILSIRRQLGRPNTGGQPVEEDQVARSNHAGPWILVEAGRSSPLSTFVRLG